MWRHNNIIRIVLGIFRESECFKSGNLEIYADIENNTVGGGTIPPDIIATAQKPDIVLYWRKDKRIILFELSVPFEPNISKAHLTKIDRYSSLVSDICDVGTECSLIAVEIGSRGLIDADNKNRLIRLLKLLKISTKYTEVKNQISSYSIYNSRFEPKWSVQNI